MNRNSSKKSIILFLFTASAFIFLGAAPLSQARNPGNGVEIVTLKDFTKQEVRGAGITLLKDMRVHIYAVGGGEKSMWRDMFDDNESQQMYAAAWIINADTRHVVWDMTMDNTSGKARHRTYDDDIQLKKGSYEIYFMAYGYATGGTFSQVSINIDRRESHRSSNSTVGGIFRLFGGGDDRELYDEFIDYAKDTWGITLTVPSGEATDVKTFEPPKNNAQAFITATRLGDQIVYRKAIRVAKELKVHVYAVGEGRRNEDLFDYGWLVDTETRERVWEMNVRNVEYAGGASKNICYEGDVTLRRGMYDLYYMTDGSHSNDDWNARPPYDPFNYGITLSVVDPDDRGAVEVTVLDEGSKNVIVKLTEMRDNDYKSAGFSLKTETKLHVYGLGERVKDGKDMADFGWIVNAKTRARVWSMAEEKTYHAGGASKNRLVDEMITLPKGDYIAYYQTDGSHAYNDWNADPPFDPEHWGLTIMGEGKGFDATMVSTFNEENEEGVIAQLIRVRDDRTVHQKFAIDNRTKVRVYAVGEADGDEMADYGWIENAETGERVWEMEYDKTTWAGGARKNRMFDNIISLDKGEYELHYQTDGSHAYGDWNDDPPNDRTHWGITVYTSQ